MKLLKLEFSKSNHIVFEIRILILIVLICFGAISVSAEIDTTQTSADKEKASNYKISLQTGNSVIQNGRAVGQEGIYVQPGFNYYHTSGFYAGLMAIYMRTDKKRTFQNATFNIGYDKEIGNHFSLGIDYTYNHYFSASAKTAGIPHSFILNASWFSKIITPTISAIWCINQTSTYSTSFDLMHSFIFHRIFTKKDKLSFPVIAGVYLGSSNNLSYGFTSAYLLGGVKYRIGFFSIGSSLYYSIPINQPANTSTAKPSIKLSLAFYF